MGALTQAPRHSTSSHEKSPSAETWNGSMMDAPLADPFQTFGPRSMQGVVPHSSRGLCGRPERAGTWSRRSRFRARVYKACRACRPRTRSPCAASSRPLAPGRATDRDHGGLLPARRVFRDLLLRPVEVFRREGETLRLNTLGPRRRTVIRPAPRLYRIAARAGRPPGPSARADQARCRPCAQCRSTVRRLHCGRDARPRVLRVDDQIMYRCSGAEIFDELDADIVAFA